MQNLRYERTSSFELRCHSYEKTSSFEDYLIACLLVVLFADVSVAVSFFYVLAAVKCRRTGIWMAMPIFVLVVFCLE